MTLTFDVLSWKLASGYFCPGTMFTPTLAFPRLFVSM